MPRGGPSRRSSCTTTDRTLALWRDVRPDGWRDGGADVGLVIQSALRRSDDDIEAIIAEGGRVRLCKGAYKEPAGVAYQDKAEVDAAYERQMLRLMRAGRYPALATHDVKIIKRAVSVARAEGIDKDAFEFQMLYGVRRDIQEQLAGAGWRVRTYVPFGSQWYPYFMRRLAERPANVPSSCPPVVGARQGLTITVAEPGGRAGSARRSLALCHPGIQEPPVGLRRLRPSVCGTRRCGRSTPALGTLADDQREGAHRAEEHDRALRDRLHGGHPAPVIRG